MSGKDDSTVNKDKMTNELEASNDIVCSQVKVSGEKGKISDLIFRDGSHIIENVLDTMVNPVSYKDKNGVFLLVNEAHARTIIGLPKEEVIGRTLLELARKFSDSPRKYIVEKNDLLEGYNEEGCNEWIRIENEILNHGGTRTIEQELIVADGTTKTFILNKSALCDEEGETIGIVTVMQDITELRKTEKILKESLSSKNELSEQIKKNEEMYKTILEKTGQMVYNCDILADKVDWLGSVEEVTGYTPEELKGAGVNLWMQYVHPEDRHKLWINNENHMKNGGNFRLEYRFRKKNGGYACLEENGTDILDSSGGISRVIGVVKDITEQKFASQNLQESEERYRTAAEQTGQLVFDFRIETHKVEWAGAIREITGYSPEEFKNFGESSWIEHLHPEDRTKMIKSMENFFRKKARIQAEFRFRKKDGKYIYVEIRGIWLNDEKEKVYRAIGVMKDITEWKCTLEKIEASEIKYRSLIQNFQGIAFQTDKNFIPIFIHGAVEEITGHTEEELMSRGKWKEIILPEDLPLILKEEERIRDSPGRKYAKVDFRIIHRDGKIRWLHEIYQKILGKDGKPKFYQGTIYDITERKETEEFLANIKIARQREIHHRIKNNLQVISSLLDLQAEKFNNMECVTNSEVLEAFRESQDRVLSISLIHEELHEGEGTEKLNFSPYLKKLIGNLFQTYRLGDAAISLKTELEENIFFDMDIAVPLGLIVNELVSNSLKHAFSNGKNGEIRIRLSRNDKLRHLREGIGQEGESTEFNLTVSDNGKGIPETVDFENPETLGLQLVSILVNQLEGEIKLKRENGTEFSMRFKVKNKL
ncbi:sensory transduction histidine kinase [Methanosarcina barkeri str. Wiesmoor]|uniref:Sensory transduction histidine kinase n=2 Tax=Methanosarcina barkeri TaxID=2208 RepID=A0A0E3QNL6_METBA|nr:PAS domain-containing protein [Methanosarcina barkeri]AKB51429.1 sensory transduction histidine kinase [Methanosarcina barkeri str. Wiesmoor]